jgi:hypothetical protein
MTEMFYVNQEMDNTPVNLMTSTSNSRQCGVLDSHIIYNRDFNYIILIQNIERSYLLKINGKIIGETTTYVDACFCWDSLR